ncbi:MAG: hypothetical protein JWP44_389 [Mucilaginibacter sp.]|nr:hypothetical protein [Mucilaginibacter sp.]
MKKIILIAAVVLFMGLLSNTLFAQAQQKDTVKKATTTAAAADTSAKDIVTTLANVAEETTLTAAIKAANLDTELKGPGPFTVLAPNNDNFATIPKSKMDSLMKDPTKLALVVKAHIISGKYDKAAFIKALVAGKGKATLTTIDGQTLTLSVKDKKLAITDAQGTTVQVTSFDTLCTNGVIHGINGVLMAK